MKHTISSISSHMEPHNYTEASKHNCWQQAMKDELDALATNNTWIITSLPQVKLPLDVAGIIRSNISLMGP